jgi:hypothetical protein
MVFAALPPVKFPDPLLSAFNVIATASVSAREDNLHVLHDSGTRPSPSPTLCGADMVIDRLRGSTQNGGHDQERWRRGVVVDQAVGQVVWICMQVDVRTIEIGVGPSRGVR